MRLELPERFWQVPYDGDRYPGATPREQFDEGANCQLFAYEVLRHFGFEIPDLMSSELWADTAATALTDRPEPLDLVLFNHDSQPYGAHVGLVWGADVVLHLCKEVGTPAVWPMAEFAARPRYACTLGYKRPLRQ